MPINDSPTTSPTTISLWICGHNMTGYLPEADTLAFTSWSDAKLYLLGAMKYAIESIETGDPDPWGETYAESLVASCEDLNLSSGPDWSDVLDAGEHAAMSWWINVETFTDRDAVYQRACDVLDDDSLDALMSDLDVIYENRARVVPDTGSYVPFAIMDDGEALCSTCVRDETNPVHVDGADDGWRVEGWSHSGETDQLVTCAHCERTIVDAHDVG